MQWVLVWCWLLAAGLLGPAGVLRGQVMLQALPSIAAAQALAPPPGARVLDMCAAPGGKTTLLAQVGTLRWRQHATCSACPPPHPTPALLCVRACLVACMLPVPYCTSPLRQIAHCKKGLWGFQRGQARPSRCDRLQLTLSSSPGGRCSFAHACRPLLHAYACVPARMCVCVRAADGRPWGGGRAGPHARQGGVHPAAGCGLRPHMRARAQGAQRRAAPCVLVVCA